MAKVQTQVASSVSYGGRYALLDLVGAGGAGTVYRARDLELDEIVALKVLRKELVRSAAFVERFRSEVKLARRITHRNIARMFDIGEHDGERFLTMEFIEGQMLSSRIYSGPDRHALPLSLLQALEIGQQVCAGLSAAHAVGVIHRDLKPDNVILARDGRVVITDFGIARALQPSESATTATGEFIGTPEYMSPEQAEGGAIDFRTDIYSFGVMLFEILTGTVPFTGPTPLITAAARLLKPPPDPRTRRLDLSDAIAQVVLRCMAQKPHDRYPSADAVAEALLAVQHSVAGRPSSSLPLLSVPAAAASTPHASDGHVSITSPGTASGQHAAMGHTITPVVTIDLPQKSIVVLPFRNQGPPGDEYLADGLTDDLTDSLSMASGLRVRSRSSIGLPSGAAAPTDLLAVARTAGIQVVVEGTVRRSGETLRISARLVQVEDGVQIWAQRFDRPASDALQVSDEVARAVATALNGSCSAPQRTAMQDTQAVDLYLRARALFTRGDRTSVAESAKLLEQALALRPTDPTCLSLYSQAQCRLWFFGGDGIGDRAVEAAERAIAVAPERVEPRVALATVRVHRADPAGAVRELLEVIRRTPALADAHDLLGRILLETGPLGRGIRHLEIALELEPRLRRICIDRARIHALLGQWQEADRMLAMAQEGGAAPSALWVFRTRFLAWRGDRALIEEAMRHPDMASQLGPTQDMLKVISGRQPFDPNQLLTGGLWGDASSPRGRMFRFQLTTELYCVTRDADAALRAMARSVDLGLFDLGWLDRCQPLDLIRLDPRFRSLRKIVAGRAQQVQELLK